MYSAHGRDAQGCGGQAGVQVQGGEIFQVCSMTRLGVDYKWEDERWKKAMERVEGRVDEIEYLEESEKTRRGGELLPVSGAKKRKLEI